MVNAADGAIRRTLHSQTRGGGRGAGDSEKWRMHSASLVFEIIGFMICKTCAHELCDQTVCHIKYHMP